MLHHKAIRFRNYPTEEQTTLIHQMFGCARFVFKHFLARWNDTFQETARNMKIKSQTPAVIHVPPSCMLMPNKDNFNILLP
ncbi:hypothetical protein QJ48_00345 [Paenibacillus sp. A3]|nr:helix-turn-helix domain-containing protein [Paenibacillus sp. A3]KPV61411.1 hypothetical protein QJ48_00345 [Paenibacillus sp. A3]